jgi:uncharacterized membrane protein YedE/YeeE
MKNSVYVLVGIFFGILLYKSEAVSWYRIQEMFMFKSFHMYGIIGSAVFVGATSVYVLKKIKAKSLEGELIQVADKKMSSANILGGIIYGLGLGLIGTCPGPIYVLIGSGYTFMFIVLLSALVGTWVYSSMREKLPH